MKWLVSSLTVNDEDLQDIHELLLTWCQASQSMIKKTVSQHQANVRFWTWGSGPLLCMAGYSSQCELFFIVSKFYFDRVDPLEPNFLVLDNIDIVRSKIVKIIKIFEKLEHLKTNRPQSGVIFFLFLNI